VTRLHILALYTGIFKSRTKKVEKHLFMITEYKAKSVKHVLKMQETTAKI